MSGTTDHASIGRRALGGIALASLVVTAAFWAFFDVAKHRPELAALAPFIEDPYDAVGSFGVQLALAAALLALLRVLRPYATGQLPAAQARLVLRSAAVAFLAVFLTALADAVALARHTDTWLASTTGRELALLVGAATVLSGVVAAVLLLAARPAPNPSARAWLRAGAVVAAGALVLALYPEGWRRGVVGAILTAVAGALVLFLGAWALTTVLAPADPDARDDLLDDLRALVGRGRAAPAPSPGSEPVRELRAHPARWTAALALAGGATLALVKAVGEGLPPGVARVALVIAVVVGLEGAGIALGIVLFRRLLGLARATSS